MGDGATQQPQDRDTISLSVVVPAFNEAARIGASLETIAAYLAEQPFTSEIIVVDDGSTDDTADVVRTTAASLPARVRLLCCDANRGKGHALKVGFAASAGSRVLFSDADLSTPIREAGRLLAALDEGADVAIASRKMAGARISVHQPWWRETMGKAFTSICHALISDVSDVTCGFKAYRGAAGRDVFSRCKIPDWSFDAEALFIAGLRSYRVVEVAVEWENAADTKVRIWSAVLTSLLGLARVRFYAATGVYDALTAHEPVRDSWSSREAGAVLPPGIGERA